MSIHVAFTSAEAAPAPVGIVVDVLRATSTIAQALAAGYRRVLCCAEIEEALTLRAELPDALVGGERNAVQVEGFDVGASPREFLEARADTLILSTTNGTRAILETAEGCDEVVLGSQVAREILRHLTQHKLTVIWLFDESESMKDDQRAIKEKFDSISTALKVHVETTKKQQVAALTHTIVGFGQQLQRD